MQDHVGRLLALQRLCIFPQPHDVSPDVGWVFAVVAAIKRRDQLRQYAPDKLFIGVLVLQLQSFDDLTQVSVPTVFHVEMEVLRGLEVVSLKVLHDVCMFEFLEDGELGLQLFAFFRGHFRVADLFPAEHLGRDQPTALELYLSRTYKSIGPSSDFLYDPQRIHDLNSSVQSSTNQRGARRGDLPIFSSTSYLSDSAILAVESSFAELWWEGFRADLFVGRYGCSRCQQWHGVGGKRALRHSRDVADEMKPALRSCLLDSNPQARPRTGTSFFHAL